MAKQRYINTRFWDDGYITTLDPIEKLLFIYFLTNPLTEISGAYEIQLKRVALDTGIDRDMVQKILNRFADEDKIIYRDGWILVANFVKHQSMNPSVQTGIENALNCCPDWIKDRLTTACDRLSHLNLNKSNLIESNDGDAVSLAKTQKTMDVEHIFEFWKTTMSLNGSTLLTPKREKAIRSRIKQGYSIERIKNAIRGCASSPFNMGVNERHTKYNDIELICRTGEKLEYYEQMFESTVPVKTISDEEIKMREALLASQEMGKVHYKYD